MTMEETILHVSNYAEKKKVTLFQNGYWKMQHQTFQTFHFQLET